MFFSKSANSIISILFIFIVAALLLNTNAELTEGFDTIPLATDPKTKKILYGYYQVNDSQMATVPYGFAVDPKNPKQIVPTTKLAISELKPKYKAEVPAYGDKMPDTFYLVCLSTKSSNLSVKYGTCVDASLAVLPPNMSPNLVKIDFSDNPAKTLYYYSPGYISQTQYYENQFTPEHMPSSLPNGVYYVDKQRTKVSLLEPEYVADNTKGYGKIKNPNIHLSTSNYRNTLENYNAQFHDEMNNIVKNSKLYDLQYDEVKVKDQNGNIIVLPKTKSQDSITFYKPGEFPFGASTYVPNYEDSVYLSSIGYRTKFGNTPPKQKCDELCQAYNDFKTKMDTHCPNTNKTPTPKQPTKTLNRQTTSRLSPQPPYIKPNPQSQTPTRVSTPTSSNQQTITTSKNPTT